MQETFTPFIAFFIDFLQRLFFLDEIEMWSVRLWKTETTESLDMIL